MDMGLVGDKVVITMSLEELAKLLAGDAGTLWDELVDLASDTFECCEAGQHLSVFPSAGGKPNCDCGGANA